MSLLWFRRSKRAAEKQEPDATVEAEAPLSQARLPLHIRNLLLLNLQPADGVEQIESAPPLGTRADVVKAIRAAVPGIEFDAGRGELATSDGRVTIDLGPDDTVHAAVAAAEGDAAVEMLRGLMQQSRWRAYSPKAGVFIAPQSLDLFALPESGPGNPA